MIELSSLYPILPEIIILSMAAIILMADAFVGQHWPYLTYGLAQVTLVAVGVITFRLLHHPTVFLFDHMFILDPKAGLYKLFIYICTFLAFLYAQDYLTARKIPQGEYYCLGLFTVLGMMVMVSSYNFIPLFLGIELQALPLYAMIALKRDSALTSEAAFKYFILGSLASAMLLYGLSLLYGFTHTLNIDEVAQRLTGDSGQHLLICGIALTFIVTGIAFKFGAAPFHVWAPDVYTGAPSIVTLFLGSAPKIATLGLSMRFLVDALPHLLPQWQLLLTILAVVSMGLGNIVAVVQTNLKRMLAYSSIAHMGYMFLGVIAGTPNGYAAASFYIITYALMTCGAFAMILLIKKMGFEAEEISDFRGLNSRNPWLAFMLLVILFSLAGIPPTVGFFAKLGVIEALVQVHNIWLPSLALIFAVIGSYYYIAVIKVMYFEEPTDPTHISIPTNMRVAISFNGLILLAYGLFPSSIIQLCRTAFL